MKKILSLLLILCVVFSASGCGIIVKKKTDENITDAVEKIEDNKEKEKAAVKEKEESTNEEVKEEKKVSSSVDFEIESTTKSNDSWEVEVLKSDLSIRGCNTTLNIESSSNDLKNAVESFAKYYELDVNTEKNTEQVGKDEKEYSIGDFNSDSANVRVYRGTDETEVRYYFEAEESRDSYKPKYGDAFGKAIGIDLNSIDGFEEAVKSIFSDEIESIDIIVYDREYNSQAIFSIDRYFIEDGITMPTYYSVRYSVVNAD